MSGRDDGGGASRCTTRRVRSTCVRARCSRCFDVPLVNTWYREHVSYELPTKVKVSYQKLLKGWVMNQLHRRSPKVGTPWESDV